MKPSGLARPYITATTAESMTLEWDAPEDNGACPITGYALYRDDGLTGSPTIEINSDNDIDIRNKPTLRSAIALFDLVDLGTSYSFLVRVYNREGETDGTVATYLFSTTPDAPIEPPRIVVQSSSLIRVEYVFDAGTGGSPTLSYNLQFTNTHSGSFMDAVGSEDADSLNYTLKTIYDLYGTAIQKSITYSFRYRVLNLKGWSAFSDITYVVAADVPSQPEIMTILA